MASPLPSAAVIQRAQATPATLSSQDVLTLQRSMGNQAVQQLLASPAQPTAQHTAQPTIQAKLTVGAANDHYEREADQVAATVMRQIHTPAKSPTAAATPHAQPSAPASLSATAQRKTIVQRKTDETASIDHEGGTVGTAMTQSIQRARGSGQPLEATTRAKMEGAFGADFSGVKVHTDARADQLNRSMNADAFTTGSDLFFRQGSYSPGDSAGQTLIAHELTHVIQQGSAQQSNSQNVQRKTQPNPVQVRGQLPANRVSTKRRMMHLDFVKMKRQDADFKRMAAKFLGIKMKDPKHDHGTFGHYWTEIGEMTGNDFRAQKSYGWWPKDGAGIRGALQGVEGELNRGAGTDKDPNHGQTAETEFHPVMNVDPDVESYDDIKTRVVGEIENFATNFSGSWNWRLGWGKNCQTFQDRLKKKVGLHFKSAKEWLRDPEKVRQQAEQEKAEVEYEDRRTQAVSHVVGTYKVPDNMNLYNYSEITAPGDEHRTFQDNGAGLRAGGLDVGATGKTAMGKAGRYTPVEKMVEFVFADHVHWMTAAEWQMYFGQAYPENQSNELVGNDMI